MLNVVFINTCFTILLNDNTQIKRTPSLYRDLQEIVTFYKENYDTPISLKNNVDCILELCRLRMKNKTAESCVDSLIQSQKYKDIEGLLLENLRKKLSDEEVYEMVSQIRNRKKYTKALNSYKTIMGFFERLDSGAMDSMDEAIDKYDSMVKVMYADLMESNRMIEIESSASIDPLRDKNTGIADKIKLKYSKKNRVPSGFPQFDELVLGGGFEKSRVYIFGGTAGSGKSTLMLNICHKSAFLNSKPEYFKKDQIKVFLFVTLEDQIDESYLKLYQMLFKKTKEEALSEIDNGVNIEERVTQVFDEHQATIVMKYYPSKSICPMDLNSAIDDIQNVYGPGSLQLLVVDYLDLLKPEISRDALRHELGDIVLSLKTISINHAIPVLVPTQLNKEAYNNKLEGQQLNVGMIGESMQKVHNADFISTQVPDGSDPDHLVHFKVGKNRSGKNNITFSFRVDFERCLFIRATTADKPRNKLPEYMTMEPIPPTPQTTKQNKISRTLPNNTISPDMMDMTTFDKLNGLFNAQ